MLNTIKLCFHMIHVIMLKLDSRAQRELSSHEHMRDTLVKTKILAHNASYSRTNTCDALSKLQSPHYLHLGQCYHLHLGQTYLGHHLLVLVLVLVLVPPHHHHHLCLVVSSSLS